MKTNLNANASHFDEKQKDIPQKEKGMSLDRFSQVAVEAIFNKESEVIIDQEILSRLAVVFRNLWPNLVFANVARKTRKNNN